MPMHPRLARALLVLLSAVACARRADRAAPAPAGDEIVATVDGAPIGRRDLIAEIGPGGGDARAALDRLIDRELLAAQARRALDPDDPELSHERARATVQRMLERELEPRLDKSAIPDEQLRALYDKARSVFVHPRLVEVALLSVYTGARMKDEPRARAFETATALEAALRSRTAATPEDFKAVGDQPAWRDRRVKYARLWQALDEPFPIDVGRAVAALSHPGDTTPLIVAETGYHIARYIGERPAENVSFEAARSTLRDQMAERWRRAQFLEFVQAAANPHAIEAFPERLGPTPGP